MTQVTEIEKAVRLFKFLAEAQKLGTKVVRDIEQYEANGAVQLFADLPAHDAGRDLRRSDEVPDDANPRLRIHIAHELEICRIDIPALSSPACHKPSKDPVLWERLPNSTCKLPKDEVDEFVAKRFSFTGG